MILQQGICAAQHRPEDQALCAAGQDQDHYICVTALLLRVILLFLYGFAIHNTVVLDYLKLVLDLYFLYVIPRSKSENTHFL